MFITLEGQDGSGKSMQAGILFKHLKREEHDVILTREPGGSPGAEEIRSLILSGEADRWSPETELLLFNAARRDHLEKTILPALERGAIVLCDRFADSTRVYQGAARSDIADMVEALHALMIPKDPDLTIILDMDPRDALRRSLDKNGSMNVDEARFERMGFEFQDKLANGYRDIAKRFPDRCVLIDATGTPGDVHARILTHLDAALSRHMTKSVDPLATM